MGQEIDLSFITNRTVVTYANMLKNPDEETIMRRNMSLELTSASLRSFLLRVMVFNPFKRPNSIDLLDDQIFKAVRNPA
jgi:serine/threonine protein kinase